MLELTATGEGAAYTVGKINGDHWLLYLTSPFDAPAQPLRLPPVQPERPSPRPPLRPSRPDQTLEILMSRLDPAACAQFLHPSPSTDADDGHATGAALSTRLGLDALLPGSTIDGYLFKPCGFSLNAVQRDRYATVHVTPEIDWSYASFETNAELGSDGNPSLAELVRAVLDVFRPGRLSITLFVSQEEADEPRAAGAVNLDALLGKSLVKGWRRKDRILYESVCGARIELTCAVSRGMSLGTRTSRATRRERFCQL